MGRDGIPQSTTYNFHLILHPTFICAKLTADIVSSTAQQPTLCTWNSILGHPNYCYHRLVSWLLVSDRVCKLLWSPPSIDPRANIYLSLIAVRCSFCVASTAKAQPVVLSFSSASSPVYVNRRTQFVSPYVAKPFLVVPLVAHLYLPSVPPVCRSSPCILYVPLHSHPTRHSQLGATDIGSRTR